VENIWAAIGALHSKQCRKNLGKSNLSSRGRLWSAKAQPGLHWAEDSSSDYEPGKRINTQTSTWPTCLVFDLKNTESLFFEWSLVQIESRWVR
jgi:hypothetical protein